MGAKYEPSSEESRCGAIRMLAGLDTSKVHNVVPQRGPNRSVSVISDKENANDLPSGDQLKPDIFGETTGASFGIPRWWIGPFGDQTGNSQKARVVRLRTVVARFVPGEMMRIVSTGSAVIDRRTRCLK